MSGQAEEAGAALLAALTGLSPAAATPERSEPQKASAGQFSLGGSSALKAAASKGFKFKKEEPQAAAAQEEPKPKVSPLLTPTQIERAASPAKMTHEEVERMMQVKLQVVGAGGKADSVSEEGGAPSSVDKNAIEKAVVSAVRAIMEDTIVPAFEQSCREMFRQMNGALKAGVRDHLGETEGVAKQLNARLEALEAVVKGMDASVRSLDASVNKSIEASVKGLEASAKSLDAAVRTLSSKQSSGAAEKKQRKPREDPKIQIKADLDQKRYEEAFSKALMTQNVEVVLWLCQQIGEDEFFYSEPFPLSQSVLLALLQQLGSDLNKAREMKLSWIQRVLIVLDMEFFEREGLLPHLPPVLSEVQKNLNSANLKPKERPRLEVVKAVLNSVQFTVNAKLGS